MVTTAPRMHLNYGGTFDPVHCGHIEVARSAARQLGATVHLVPCADPPHRAAPVATATQRSEMLRLAIAGDPLLALDLRELRRGGASYTIDTMAQLREELGPDAPIACLIGADALRGLPGWRDWPRLFDLVHVVALTRPGHALDDFPAPLARIWAARRAGTPQQLALAPGGAVLALEVPAWEVSSTRVRAELAAGRVPHGSVPAAVLDWIGQHRLYRAPLRPPR